MDDEKNVFLRIVHEDEEQDDSLNVDFSLIWKHMKRFLAVWLCLALGLGSLAGACAFFARKSLSHGQAQALLHVASSDYDVSKIKSPGVIEDALTKAGMDRAILEKVRTAIDVKGIIPNSAYEAMSLYYGLIAENKANADTIRSLLGTNYEVSEYIVSLDVSVADLSDEDGVLLLNALLRAYQDYCLTVYNKNAALTNPLNAIDYRDYDYAEAADVFDGALDNVLSYLEQLNKGSAAASYRSSDTGFTFADLGKMASSLKEIDFDRIASYIMIHSVSANPPEVQVSYYEWLIENLEQQRAVQRTRFNALADSIDAYDKDSIVILTGQDGAAMAPGAEDINANYDAMIQEKLDAQSLIASYNRSISYYQKVIDGFRQTDASASREEDITYVEEALASLNGKFVELANDVSLTANEYYEKVTFSDQIRVLVSAVLKEPDSSLIIKTVLVIEGALALAYLAAAFIIGLREANPQKEREGSPKTGRDERTESVPLAE